MDKQLETAIDAIRKWYYDEIRSLADNAIEECNGANSEHIDGVLVREHDEQTLREWIDEWLHETIDGHQFVIYTFQAKCALLASDNEDAMENECGETGTVEQRCYFAMRTDVMELLEARTDEWIPTNEENESEAV